MSRKERWELQKRINGYAAQIRYVDGLFEAEMSKPLDAQDEALLRECLDTLDYLHDCKAKLTAELAAAKKGFSLPRLKRPGLAFAAACLAVIFLGAGIAEALGFSVLRIFSNWSNGVLRVFYSSDGTPPVWTQEPGKNNEDDPVRGDLVMPWVEYATLAEAVRDLGINPKLPPPCAEEDEVTITGAISPYGDALLELLVFINNSTQHDWYNISIHKNDDPNASITYAAVSDEGSVASYESDGVTYTMSSLDGMVTVTWLADGMFYSLSTTFAREDIPQFIDSFVTYND